MSSRQGNEEYKKIHKQVLENTTPIINALKELPIYYRYHIKKGIDLGKIKNQKEEDKKKYKIRGRVLQRDSKSIK